MKKLVSMEQKTVTFDFEDGTNEVAELAKVPGFTGAEAGTVLQLALHGISQKVGDSAAGAAKEANPLEFAKAQIRDTIAQVYAGEWRVSAGGGGARITDFALAIAQASGTTEEQAQEMLNSCTDEEKKVLKANPHVKLALAKISAQRALERAEAAAKAAEGAAAFKIG